MPDAMHTAMHESNAYSTAHTLLARNAEERRGEERRGLRGESGQLSRNPSLSNAQEESADPDAESMCPEPCACEQLQPECCDQPRWKHDVGIRSDSYLCLRGRGCDAA